MNDELKTKMLEYLGHAESLAKAGADQLPGIAHEVVTFSLVQSAILVVALLAVLGTMFSPWAIRKIWRLAAEFDGAGFIVCIFVYPCVTATALTFLAVNLHTLIMCYFAPRVFLLEYLGNLIK